MGLLCFILGVWVLSAAGACSPNRRVIKNETLDDLDGQRMRYKNLFPPKYGLGEEIEGPNAKSPLTAEDLSCNVLIPILYWQRSWFLSQELSQKWLVGLQLFRIIGGVFLGYEQMQRKEAS